MSFEGAIRKLNELKRRRVIRDYVLIGAVAATVYMEPMFTENLDIVVLVDSDDEYLAAFRTVAAHAERMEGMHYYFDDVPVQMFPSTISRLFRDVKESARTARLGDVRVKVATPEHLIVLLLEAYRPKDRLRIPYLLEAADHEKLNRLLERFDDDQGNLAKKLEAIRERGL